MFDPDFDYSQLLSEEEHEAAQRMTPEEILEESLMDLMTVGRMGGLDDDTLGYLLAKVGNSLSENGRKSSTR